MQPGLSAFDVTAFSVMFIVGGFAGAWVGLYPFHEAIRGSIFGNYIFDSPRYPG